MKTLLAVAIILLLAGVSASVVAAHETRTTQKAASAAAAAAQRATDHATGLQNQAILKNLTGALARHTQSLQAINRNAQDILRVQRDFVLIIATSCKAEISEHAPASDIHTCRVLLHKIKHQPVISK